jgi:hypothetical protein
MIPWLTSSPVQVGSSLIDQGINLAIGAWASGAGLGGSAIPWVAKPVSEQIRANERIWRIDCNFIALSPIKTSPSG